MGNKMEPMPLESALRAKTPVRGLSDFLSKIPFLAYHQIAAGGGVVESAWISFRDDKAYKRPNEISEHVLFRGVGFRWGLYEENRILTRLEHEATPLHSENLASLLDEHYEDGKFARGVLVPDKEIVIAVSLADLSDRAEGNVRPYWNSYWSNAMKPLLAFILGIGDKAPVI